MADIIVVGGRNFTLGFSLAGVEKIHDTEDGNAQQIFKDILAAGNEELIVTDADTFAALDVRLRETLEASANPVLVVLSGEESAAESLRERVKSAIGIDVWDT